MGKNFDDFRNGFQSLDFELLARKLNEKMIKGNVPLTEERANEFATAIIAQNLVATFEILEAYHLWVNQPEDRK